MYSTRKYFEPKDWVFSFLKSSQTNCRTLSVIYQPFISTLCPSCLFIRPIHHWASTESLRAPQSRCSAARAPRPKDESNLSACCADDDSVPTAPLKCPRQQIYFSKCTLKNWIDNLPHPHSPYSKMLLIRTYSSADRSKQ